MRLDSVSAEIRPRSDWEAVDLGFAMVQRSFWRCISVWWLALILPSIAACVLLWDYPMLILIIFWWVKPAGSRMVLFELSRRLFGEEPSWRAVWRELPRAWWRRFFYRFMWARFSPWLPVTLAVEDLEGLRGRAYRQRCGQVVRRGEGAVMGIYFISDIAAAWLGLALLVLILLFIPEGQGGAWQRALESWDPNNPFEIPMLITRLVVGCVMVAMSLTDVFVTGAGFGVYINNRTWIEGWDVELAFKRLAQRLGKVALVIISFIIVSTSAQAQEEEPRSPSQVMEEVKSDETFKVHTVTEKVPKSKSNQLPNFNMPADLIMGLLQVFAVSVIALLLGFIGWVLWKNRHVFGLRTSGLKLRRKVPSARVVMGMEVSPDTLPGDVPMVAWALWQQDRKQEALGLLYRGAISRVMELGQVEIHESDTEGDCMRRVEAAGARVFPDYFRGITGIWIQLAYAGEAPADSDVERLCQQWPFGGREAG